MMHAELVWIDQRRGFLKKLLPAIRENRRARFTRLKNGKLNPGLKKLGSSAELESV